MSKLELSGFCRTCGAVHCQDEFKDKTDTLKPCWIAPAPVPESRSCRTCANWKGICPPMCDDNFSKWQPNPQPVPVAPDAERERDAALAELSTLKQAARDYLYFSGACCGTCTVCQAENKLKGLVK